MTYTISMDSAGRLVLPKAVRERYGLAGAPAELELNDTPDGIVLRPKGETVPLVRDPSGWLVFDSGGERESVDPVQLVEEMRNERIRSLLGDE